MASGARPAQNSDAATAMREMFQHAPPGWVGQGGKSAVEQSRRTLNHMVKHYRKAIHEQGKFSENCRFLDKQVATECAWNLTQGLMSPGNRYHTGDVSAALGAHSGTDFNASRIISAVGGFII